MLGVAANRLNEVLDQVVAAFELDVNVGPGGFCPILETDEPVEKERAEGNRGHGQQDRRQRHQGLV